MDEFDESSSNQKVSKYNSAVAQLFRLDKLWQDAHRFSLIRDLIRWNLTLDKVWAELASAFKENGDEDNKFKTFSTQLDFSKIPEKKGFSSIEKDEARNMAYLYSVLLEKEIWLRRMQDACGKGMAYKDSEEDYLDE